MEGTELVGYKTADTSGLVEDIVQGSASTTAASSVHGKLGKPPVKVEVEKSRRTWMEKKTHPRSRTML